MKIRLSIHSLIIVSFFCALLSDAIYYINVAMKININGDTFILILRLLSFTCLMIVGSSLKWKKEFPAQANIFFKAMMLWNLITIVRGLFIAHTYWDWKYLLMNTTLAFLIPYAIIAGAAYSYSQNLFKIIVTKLFVFGFLIIPLTVKYDIQRELFPRGVMVTCSFFVLIIPFVKTKWRVVIMCVALTSVFIALDFRTNIVRVVLSLFIVALYYARRFITLTIMKLTCIACFITPFIFLLLGVTNQFDVFKPSANIDKYKIEYDNGLENNLAEDTRTFLYQELLLSMRSRNSFLFGESAVGTYTTDYFEGVVGQSRQRYGSEVGFLNLLLYAGIIGVLLYALVLFSAVYYSIAHSANFFCKMLGLFLAFKWVMFFIEDFNVYNMNYFVLWLAAGLCFSKRFRALSDADIVNYFDFSGKKSTALQPS